jgi:DNA-binding transcriptional regulator YiaG
MQQPRNFFEKRRRELNLSQRKMAMRLELSNDTVIKWETYRSIPSTPVARLAEKYEVTPQEIERALTIQRRVIESNELAAAGK